jgi:hypothetical protein
MQKTCTLCGVTHHCHGCLCTQCEQQIRAQALAEQERDYVANYLHERVDANGYPLPNSALTVTPQDRKELLRLVDKARAAGVNWNTLHAPQTFHARRARLIENAKGSTARRSKVPTQGSPIVTTHIP